jgi:hypothetical protein
MPTETVYNAMVCLTDPAVVDFGRDVTGYRSIESLLVSVVQAVGDIIVYKTQQTGCQSFDRMMRTGEGNCLTISCFICAVLRKVGLAEDNVYVAVGGPPGMYRDSIHAWTVVKHDGKYRIVEPREMIIGDYSLMAGQVIYLLFNDTALLVGGGRSLESII